MLQLKGKTAKGRSRIAQFGESWRITENIHPFNLNLIEIEAIQNPKESRRWIEKDNPQHFTVLSNDL